MCTQVIMPLQTNLTAKPGELNSVINAFWPKTPQQNKFRQIMQDKNSNKKRRHHSEQQINKHTNGLINKIIAPSTPNSSLNKPQQQQQQSSPFYAGAKFSEAPLPSFLPKPPTHWINATNLTELNENLNSLTSLNNELNSLNDLSTLITEAVTNGNVIEETISILEINSKKNEKLNEKLNETSSVNGKPNNQMPSSKYYVDQRKQRSDSVGSNQFQYNFRNTRRNTPQCQTKCKNTRYSSFSRQNFHQKIAAVN